MRQLSDAQKQEIAEAVAATNSADNLKAGEVAVRDDGAIVVDRPGKDSRVIGRWA